MLGFYFTGTEQDFLHHALVGATDKELAGRLTVSPTCVKKRWNGLYERGAAAPADLPARSPRRVTAGGGAESPRSGQGCVARDLVGTISFCLARIALRT